MLSAEMRFSADKGLSAERPAGAGFLAEKWRRSQHLSRTGIEPTTPTAGDLRSDQLGSAENR